MNSNYILVSNDFLIHHGIKGQRWGIRRFQPYPKGSKNKGKEVGAATKVKQRHLNELDLNQENLEKFKKQYRNLSHVKIDKNTKGKIYQENGKIIGIVNTEKKPDGKIWIQGLEVFGDNKGKGYGKKLLEVASKELSVTNLSVRKTNNIAKNLYEKYGWEIYKSDDYMDYMRIKKKVN